MATTKTRGKFAQRCFVAHVRADGFYPQYAFAQREHVEQVVARRCRELWVFQEIDVQPTGNDAADIAAYFSANDQETYELRVPEHPLPPLSVSEFVGPPQKTVWDVITELRGGRRAPATKITPQRMWRLAMVRDCTRVRVGMWKITSPGELFNIWFRATNKAA